ncbi:hypothetical protein INT45_012981 [Circinella minor]|uniref:Uncharacterized protein n=1 Tax=Circinella minor TaxID=1195481 RepID=A0A8H7RZM3_9FUNG|nr:hypothetical protein INT45_012981 [Circinella minor]
MTTTSLLTAFCTFLLLIPIVPLLTYVIGLLLPASHIVSRKRTFKGIHQTDLWQILVNVETYPEWRPRVLKIQLNHESCTDDRIVFQEHNTRNKTIVVIHVHQVPYSRLLRILQEIPTFSGSWTFELEPIVVTPMNTAKAAAEDKKEEKHNEDQVELKITQQGVIKKPLFRVIYMLVLGLHRRIDLFLDDLERKVEQEQNHRHHKEQQSNHKSNTMTMADDQVTPTNLGDMDYSTINTSILTQNDNENDSETKKQTNTLPPLPPMESLTPSPTLSSSSSAVLETKEKEEEGQSLLKDKDNNNNIGWDMVSEIYERTK